MNWTTDAEYFSVMVFGPMALYVAVGYIWTVAIELVRIAV